MMCFLEKWFFFFGRSFDGVPKLVVFPFRPSVCFFKCCFLWLYGVFVSFSASLFSLLGVDMVQLLDLFAICVASGAIVFVFKQSMRTADGPEGSRRPPFFPITLYSLLGFKTRNTPRNPPIRWFVQSGFLRKKGAYDLSQRPPVTSAGRCMRPWVRKPRFWR